MLSLPYVAGIVDGEGCISVAKRGPYITPTVQVANTDIGLLEIFYNQFGGNIDRNRESRPNRKPCHCWRLAGRAAKTFVQQIRPWLLIKGPQANIICGLIERRPGERMDSADFKYNEDVTALIRSLNRRGHAVI